MFQGMLIPVTENNGLALWGAWQSHIFTTPQDKTSVRN